MMLRALLISVLSISLVACSGKPTRNPVPADLARGAYIPGIEDFRFVGDLRFTPRGRDFDQRLATFARQVRTSGRQDEPLRYLAISGGGQQGAFGAGLLNGWSQTGERPEFFYVTGISTGALIAPFAFLGPDYDRQMREIYTTVTTDDLVKRKRVLDALTSDSFARNDGLYETIQRYMTPELIDALAREHNRGRRLIVQTANLDTMQPVYWSISGIATTDIPNRDELIHRILLASAAIPGAFPPVYFDVLAEDGNTYDEMHVDGGAVSQVFAYPLGIDLDQMLAKHGINIDDQELYVIRNAKIDPDYQAVDTGVLSIIGRSTSSMIRTQGLGDLYKIFLGTLRDRIDFNLAYIPVYFVETWEEDFDTEYMNKLYALGEELGRNGFPWENRPPGFVLPGEE